jgi:hypothetical protein
VVVGFKSSSTVATMSLVEAAGAAQRLRRPTVEEDRKGGHRGSSMVATPSEVDAPGEAQKLGYPAVEGDHRLERWPAWLTGEVVGRRHRPQNRATSKRCQSRGLR